MPTNVMPMLSAKIPTIHSTVAVMKDLMATAKTVLVSNNYLITESEVVTGKSQTEALPY